MAFSRFTRAFALASVLASTAFSASAEELTGATFVPPQHHSNTVLFAWFAEELEARSGGTMTMQLFPAGQLGAGPVQQYKRATGELNVEWITVSDEERAKMEVAAAEGMQQIYDDYAARGIDNAQEIYEALNQ